MAPRRPPKTDPKMDLSWTSSWEGLGAPKMKLRWPKLALRWPQDEPKTAPRRVNLVPQDEHELGPILVRILGFQSEPKMAQIDPKMAQDGQKKAPRRDRLAQDVSRYAQNAFSPRCFKI